MILGLLGLRCIRWHEKKNRFVSPTNLDFYWENPVVWAKCSRGCHTIDGELIIRRDCSCGIYATLQKQEMFDYMGDSLAICLLVEALGSHNNSWAHETGFTAAGVQVIKLVDITKFTRSQIKNEGPEKMEFLVSWQQHVMQKALEVFKLKVTDIITYNLALEMMKIQWQKVVMESWPLED